MKGKDIIQLATLAGVSLEGRAETADYINDYGLESMREVNFREPILHMRNGHYLIRFECVEVRRAMLVIQAKIKHDARLREFAPSLFDEGIAGRYHDHSNGLWDRFIGEFIAGPYRNIGGGITPEWAETSIHG